VSQHSTISLPADRAEILGLLKRVAKLQKKDAVDQQLAAFQDRTARAYGYSNWSMLHWHVAKMTQSEFDLFIDRVMQDTDVQKLLSHARGRKSPIWRQSVSVTRWQPENTGRNTQALLAAIVDPGIARVTLFASPTKPDADFADSDGPDSNLPLLAALVETISGDLCVYDGLFLTAARRPRYLEVREVLDAAELSDKVYFAGTRAPFTSSRSPAEAAETLHAIAAPLRLTSTTRASFFRLICNVTEAQYNAY